MKRPASRSNLPALGCYLAPASNTTCTSLVFQITQESAECIGKLFVVPGSRSNSERSKGRTLKQPALFPFELVEITAVMSCRRICDDIVELPAGSFSRFILHRPAPVLLQPNRSLRSTRL